MNKNKIKILIVEDDLSVAKNIQNKLIHQGYTELFVVDNGVEAIELAEQQLPDLILMDIVLPNSLDGIQTTAAIQHKHQIPVIYITAYSDQMFLERAKITDPMAYIIKPVTERDLHAAITIALNKAKNQKQQSENDFLNATMVSFADALIVWDLQGEVIKANDALIKMLALEETAIIGKQVNKVFDLINPSDQKVLTEKLIYIAENSGNLEDKNNYILKCNNNPELPVRVSANRIFDSHHHSYGYVMQIRDDTERLKQDQALRESEARFRQLSEHIDSIFCLSDLKNKQIIYLSPAYEKIYGRPANISSMKTSPFLDHVYSADYEKVQTFVESLQKLKKSTQSFRIIRPDGSVRWVKTRCYPINNSTDQADRMACVIDDITEQKKSEIKLQQAASVFENTTEGIMITDADLHILGVNQAFSKITGYSETEVLGKTPTMLKSGKHKRQFYQNLWGSINETGHWQGEIINRRKNGENYPQWISISSTYDEDEKIINYVAILSDISNIKKSQDKLNYLAHHDHLTGFANRLLFNMAMN